MPTVSFDSRSFAIDGRRVWLVSGTVPYARIPSGLWRDRLRAAREAGLNCIETPVVWAAHEREPGVFDFVGELDLRTFVQTAAEEGLYCILRPGPYVGDAYDFGGLPAYLHGVTGKKETRVRFREDEPLYLEAVDRYLRALMQQVGDLQVGLPGPSGSAAHTYARGSAAGGYQGEGGGPIILMQVEHAWESHNPDQPYLTRLVSMLRQHGCAVPLINANNLWQPIDGTIDTWRGDTALPAMMRQLASVQPEAPAIVSHFDTTDLDADTLAYRIAGLIGVGAQFNLTTLKNGAASALAADTDLADKRLCTFASHFGNILANSETLPAPVVALNEEDHPATLLHQRSSQGELVMLIKSAADKATHTELMLPNGLTLDVPHADQRAAWVLLNASLGGRTTLDYTSLSPWALIDRQLLVVFGPAGATGDIAIDGEHHHATVPTGKTPLIIEGDPVTIAILNHEQIDAACRGGDGLVIGCDGFDDDGKPKPLAGWGTQFTITPKGKVTRKRISPPTKPTAPRLTKWQALSLRTLIDGTDPSYQPIAGPASLGELGAAFGYGWYRFNNKKATTGKVLPHIGGDRLHLYQKNKLAALLGTGEGAEQGAKQLKFAGDTVVLADCVWRASAGQDVGTDPKGLPDHLHTIKPIKAGKPTTTKQPAGDPFAVTGYADQQRVSARPMSQALSWSIKPESRKPIILEIDDLGQQCVVSINEQPLSYYAGGQQRLLLDPATLEAMTGGKNTVTLELLEPLADGVSIDKHIRFYQTTGLATPKDGWAFAPWTIPTSDDSNWRAVPKTLPSQPSWFRATFNVSSRDTPLHLELQGMSKGQAILNGHDLGRYWQQSREGKIISQQDRLHLPKPWLNTDEPNELMLFDEHGRAPAKCKLIEGN